MACEHHKWYAESECGYCKQEALMRGVLERIVASKTLAQAKFAAKIALECGNYKHKALVHRS
jgi:hypothetical protein